MVAPVITGVYAAFIAGLFLILSIRVIRFRRSEQIGLGDGQNKSLLKRMRAQANCAEYAPFGLILLALIELQGAPAMLCHLFGLLLLIGRALHAWGFSANPPIMGARVAGMGLTLTMIGVSAGTLLVLPML